MAYFPAFLNLKEKKILIIGGGKIAADKLGHLLDFTKDITIIAPTIRDKRISKAIERYNLRYIPRSYQKGDIEDFFIVIVAVDNIEIQKEVYKECQKRRTLCNSVDSTQHCDFIFPSYIKRDDLIIAFSTSGASPALSKYLRRAIEKLLPKEIEEFLKEIKTLRQKLPKGKERMRLFDKMAKEFIQKHFKG